MHYIYICSDPIKNSKNLQIVRKIFKFIFKFKSSTNKLKTLSCRKFDSLYGGIYFNFENFEIFIKIFLKNMKNALNLCKICTFLRFNFKKFATSTDHLVEN